MTALALPKIIAHRGASAYAPENTLAAIHTAADLGCEWVMIDVKTTKDGVAIAFYDDNLARCTGHDGAVAETGFADIEQLDAGSWYGDSFIGEKIPTLEDALNAALDHNMGVCLNLCPAAGQEVMTVEAALDAATRIWPEDIAPPLVVSTSHVSLETARDMLPEWPRGLIITPDLQNWQEMAAYLDVQAILLDTEGLTREGAEEYMESQLPLLAGPVDDPEAARELQRWGIDTLLCPNPDVISENIETRH